MTKPAIVRSSAMRAIQVLGSLAFPSGAYAPGVTAGD